MKKEISLEYGIGFADSNILSFTVEDSNLTLLLKCWNAIILKIKFLNYTSLLAMNYFRIADLLEVFESPLLERVLNELGDEKPKEHNFRVFKFLTDDDPTALEIVCEDISIEKINA